jgi:hypothetical protein
MYCKGTAQMGAAQMKSPTKVLDKEGRALYTAFATGRDRFPSGGMADSGSVVCHSRPGTVPGSFARW